MLVTCAMPTANRREFVPASIALFLAQTWPDKELLIVDDGEESVEDLIPAHPAIRYFRMTQKCILGRKRNLIGEQSYGDIIAHWDDDDWYSTTRLEYQVGLLVASGKAVTGFNHLFFWDVERQKAYKYLGNPNYACGATQMYRKDFWQKNRFLEIQNGEDTDFCGRAAMVNQIASVPCGEHCVARIHRKSTALKESRGDSMFPEIAKSELPAKFLETLCG